MERNDRWGLRDRPMRPIYPVTIPGPRRGISPATGIAIGVGVAALAVLAGAAIYRRDTGTPHPPDDAAPRLREGGHWNGRNAVAGKSILINKPRAEVYAFWRDLSNQSKFMDNVEAVRTNGSHATWTMTGALGREVEIEVDLTEERENERLGWTSVPGSQIEMQGQVTFADAPAGRGTYVELIMEYVPPAGSLGRAVANLVRQSPQVQARHGLKRLKMLLETGEIATSARTRSDQREEAV